MIKMLISFFIFCIVLFLYLHIQFHLKTSNDLEIFEIEQASKDRIEEICDFRQPVLFDLEEEQYVISQGTTKNVLLDKYPVFEIKIRDKNDEQTDNMYVPLQLQKAATLFQEDKKSTYFSENNSDFLLETGIVKLIQQHDEFLRPMFVSQCMYDVLFASDNTTTPFRQHLNYRNYYIVTQGSLQIKLSPPKSSKYLYCENDYDNFEFISPIDPWAPQSRYQDDFEKIKCLDVTLVPGKCFYIPAYWWYSFKFNNNTSVTSLSYRTYMNTIAISPQIGMYYLQNQNIHHKIINKLNLSNNNVTDFPNIKRKDQNKVKGKRTKTRVKELDKEDEVVEGQVEGQVEVEEQVTIEL